MKKVLIPEYMLSSILSPDMTIASDDTPGSMGLQVGVSRPRANGEKTLDLDTTVAQGTRASSYFPYPSNGWIIHEDEIANSEALSDPLNLDSIRITLKDLIQKLLAIQDEDQRTEAAFIVLDSILDTGITKTDNSNFNAMKEEIKNKI